MRYYVGHCRFHQKRNESVSDGDNNERAKIGSQVEYYPDISKMCVRRDIHTLCLKAYSSKKIDKVRWSGSLTCCLMWKKWTNFRRFEGFPFLYRPFLLDLQITLHKDRIQLDFVDKEGTNWIEDFITIDLYGC